MIIDGVCEVVEYVDLARAFIVKLPYNNDLESINDTETEVETKDDYLWSVVNTEGKILFHPESLQSALLMRECCK